MNGIQGAYGVLGNRETKEDERKLAKETVWRWFRIGKPEGLKKMPIANMEIASERQFFPLLDHQLDVETLTEAERVELKDLAYDNEFRQRLPQQVWGLFYDEAGTGEDNIPGLKITGYVDLNKKRTDSSGKEKLVYAKLIYPKSFSVDQDRRLVIFSDPVYRMLEYEREDGSIGKYHGPPKIYLRTACNFYHPVTRAGYRLEKKRGVGGPDKKLIDWQSREDLVPEWKKTGTKTSSYNGADILKGLNYYLDYAEAKYASKIPAHMEIPQVVPFSPDGRIAQVTYAIDGQGFISTTINKELEALNTPVTYKERRREAQAAVSQARLAKLYGNGKQDDSKGK